MNGTPFRGRTAVVGVGESRFYKHGRATDSEFKLTLDAILAAVADAGIDPRRIDGFASFSMDRSDPSRLAAALGLPELRYANMFWGGGGGGAAAVANAAAAIIAGQAKCVVVFRGIAQGQHGRFGDGAAVSGYSKDGSYFAPYGLLTPASWYAMRVTRFMHDHGIEQDALRAISLASYHHAQSNPRAVMNGSPLTVEKYDASRWIIEPGFRLYDCCMENDCAAAIILVAADEAQALHQQPAYILGAAQGSEYRNQARVYNAPNFASSSFSTVGPRLFEQAGVKPSEVDVAQSYENFTGGVLMSLIEHGFCAPEEANTFFTLENLTAPGGRLPLNTSGGNLAEAYIHGMGLIVEAVRQVQGRSTAQVPEVNISFVSSGPMVSPCSNLLLGNRSTL
ncbi:acetyl-CoA acetyltransferase-like protein [Sphingobium chlorophenolicum L-1]|uniref:Acetyl-CoA acetyltransferase-like protein n=1 Tax=Sphingobium chlorophenolicum L-1 TaxID=690566 RepID=F6F330_SPHCR|nr:acetyl-CoA acetyltransferase [Sphingobium chlorophenolicum]AEG50842.1 acetyl-CoA acetyltransferase-like protein [Sphingobium chlorophenolicum L-1]